MDEVKQGYCQRILENTFYGQHADDLIISAIFTRIGIDNPTYLDLGAHHPLKHSNTALFYLNGCRGINVEPNPKLIERFYKLRPEDINLAVGCAPEEGTLTFYMSSEESAINSFKKEEIEKRFEKNVREAIDVRVMTLEHIVQEYCQGVFPDYLDCDIEGLDYEVLRSYDLTINGPKVICVEVREEENTKFDVLLESYHYYRFCRIGENNIYVRKKYSDVVSHLHFKTGMFLSDAEIELIKQAKETYVYGAGACAKEVIPLLEKNAINITSVVVTKDTTQKTLLGYPIKLIDELSCEKNSVFIISVWNEMDKVDISPAV
jgi:FkbM family methyltransferase